jgi:hypothetical protein
MSCSACQTGRKRRSDCILLLSAAKRAYNPLEARYNPLEASSLELGTTGGCYWRVLGVLDEGDAAAPANGAAAPMDVKENPFDAEFTEFVARLEVAVRERVLSVYSRPFQVAWDAHVQSAGGNCRDCRHLPAATPCASNCKALSIGQLLAAPFWGADAVPGAVADARPGPGWQFCLSPVPQHLSI